MADLMSLEELLNPFQATQNRLKRALAQAQGQPQPDMVDQIPGMQPRGFPAGLPDQIPGNAPQAPQNAPQGPQATQMGPGPQQAPAGTQTPPVSAPAKPKGRVLTKSVASTSGTSVHPDAPFADADKKVPEIPTQSRDHWAGYDQQMRELQQTLQAPQDYSGYERVAKQRGDVAGNNLMLALLMNQTSGFEDTGRHLLRQALGAQGPQEFDEGMVDVTGKFVEKPGAKQARDIRAKEFMLTAEEKRAMRLMSADERAATIAAAERRWQAEQTAAERRHRESLGAQYAGQQKQQFHTGPDGRVYVFDPRTGNVREADVQGGAAPSQAQVIAGYPTVPLPKGASAEDKKDWTEAASAIVQTQDLQKRLAQLTKAQQGEVGGVNAALDVGMRGVTKGAVGNPLYRPSPEVREMQTAVQRDAAMLINKLYGAALSKIEAGRAGQFTVMPGDDFTTIQRKLDEAVRYATNERSRLAKTYGIPSAGGGAAGPKSAADYLKQAGG